MTVIKLDDYRKKEKKKLAEPQDRIEFGQRLPDAGYSERLAQIRASLVRINGIMADLKKMSKDKEKYRE